jgi:hypothetical protein
MPNKEPDNQLFYMKWISFIVATGLFIFAGVEAVIKSHPFDKTIAAIVLVVFGFAWGANLTKFINPK